MKVINKKQSGFTIIELLIVIVVIGILAAIVITTYSGITVKQRNQKRQTDIQSIQTQLEAFFSQNGFYPALKDINNAAWRTKDMPNLDSGNMVDPSAVNQNAATVTLAKAPAPKVFAYQVTDSNGNPCEKDDTNCAKYTLTATFEGTVAGQKPYVKQNID